MLLSVLLVAVRYTSLTHPTLLLVAVRYTSLTHYIITGGGALHFVNALHYYWWRCVTLR
jgi:hypothetical protein